MSWSSLRDLLALQERAVRAPGGAPASWVPAVDLYETADGYVVIAELPGLSRDGIGISVREGRLTIEGRREEPIARPEEYQRLERGHGSFSRAFAFQHAIDADRITADLRDGVLTVTVPKVPLREPRRVTID
jgi:HSP20 family protein